MKTTSLPLMLLGTVNAQADFLANSQLRKPVMDKAQSFLVDGIEVNLFADEVDGDFCDAASPFSLAGYMNGEFLF